MREDLLGYLLGALDDDERERVEAAIRHDPELQRRVEELQEQLQILAEEAPEEPPPGLAERTCDLIDSYRQERAPEIRAGRRRFAARSVGLSPRAQAELSGRRSPASLADVVVGTGIFLAASLLFFPAIANSRYRSEITACQYNLQRLGFALAEFSEKREGLFPQVPTTGKRGVAGVYAVQLVHDGFLSEPSVLICPASSLASQRDSWWVPTVEELDAADGVRLARLQRGMGGSYGYTLGYRIDGQYRSHRNEQRPYFALMADAPSFHLPGHQSNNHGGRGQNVLLEDGHVQFISSHLNGLFGDDLFLNRAGFAEAGMDKEDAVIVASQTAPLLAP